MAAEGEGLMHDARNLMGALTLYCDLLSVPGVLKQEHSHYPSELRLLATRSHALIEHMLESLLSVERRGGVCVAAAAGSTHRDGTQQGDAAKAKAPGKPADLRRLVESRLGMLRQVAGDRPIEVEYGPAASAPILVAEEDAERILENLVRNAGAALSRKEAAGAGMSETAVGGGAGASRMKIADGIHIEIGLLVNRADDPQPWQFRRVRLTVEDAGCGMPAAQVERLLSGGGGPSRGSHGIGFRVVRELVAGSGGSLRVKSEPGVGTCVQIEWPVMTTPATDSRGSEAADPVECDAEVCVSGCHCNAPMRSNHSSNPSGERWDSC